MACNVDNFVSSCKKSNFPNVPNVWTALANLALVCDKYDLVRLVCPFLGRNK
jgi:hypothetical protein